MNHNVFELAICFDSGYEDIKIYEYKTLKKCLFDLQYILEHNLYNEADRIELSIQEREEKDGENINTYSFATIDMKEWRKGEQK
jgi:hypothetical protein|nr:MAG TPA: hypothetical protein [Caudoviricetes sp.]